MRAAGLATVGAMLIAGLVWVLLPPLPRELARSAGPGSHARGAFHVHTRRSDGSGTVADVAAAAARAGLRFVVITDHGDGTTPRDPPVYLDGVLVIDAVEIGGDAGHVVALNLPTTLYPLGGETRDVVADVRRLGGMAIAAHPGSSRDGLQWTEWDLAVDGLEWINGDSEWRDEGPVALARAMLTYPVRPAAALTALLDRPQETLRRWEALTRARPVVGLAGGDAHARAGFGRLASLHVPGYEHVFRTMSIALPDVVLGGNAREDSRAVISAIRDGRVYSTIDGLAGPATLAVEASQGETVVGPGGRLAAGEPVAIRISSNAPPGARVVLFGDGAIVAESDGPSLTFTDPGGTVRAYRTEIHLAGAPGDPPVPWVVANPVYVGLAGPSPLSSTTPAAADAGEPLARLYADDDAGAWRIEQSPRSKAVLDEVPAVGGTQLLLRWGLGGTLSEGPYVALVTGGTAAVADARRLRFTTEAQRPMRLSVQLRTADGRRWHRSVYVDTEARDVEVRFDDMRPRDPGATGPPVAAEVRDVLFVVDTVNAVPGANGQIWLDDVRLLP